MSAPLCLIFVLGRPVFIVGVATHCLRELRLQSIFQAEKECPPHYSGPDWLTDTAAILAYIKIVYFVYVVLFYSTNWNALFLKNK